MKKLIALILIMLSATFALVGCNNTAPNAQMPASQKTDGDSIRPSTPEAPKDLTIGIMNEANNTDGQFDPSTYVVSWDAPFDSNTAIPDLGMLVPYPSEAFFILGSDDHYVQLASLDNEAVFEIWLQSPWEQRDATIDYYIDRLISFSEQAINGRMLNATDIQWYEVDIERTDYGNTASVQCVINEATYTIDGVPMRTMCRTGRWTKLSDQSSYYYSIILTATEDSFDFYLDNVYYRFRDSLMDT